MSVFKIIISSEENLCKLDNVIKKFLFKSPKDEHVFICYFTSLEDYYDRNIDLETYKL